MVEVKNAASTGVTTHEVNGTPDGISELVNETIIRNEKFVTLQVPGDKGLSVIAENVLAIWQE